MTVVVNGGTIERHGSAVNWGVAGSPIAAESDSGDLCGVWSPADGALIAVVDGSGHGVEAAAAANLARSVIEGHPRESPVALILRCHERMRGTRGAAMTLASLNLLDRTMTWLGIGNVEAVLCHGASAATDESPSAERVLLRPGVVGYRLPPRLKAEVLPLKHLDTLIIATDGVRPEFAEECAISGEPKMVAARLLAQYASQRDDALVVVARFNETGTE
jgi:negative regulator of sigma-B (phosphoserine phosphatase)